MSEMTIGFVGGGSCSKGSIGSVGNERMNEMKVQNPAKNP